MTDNRRNPVNTNVVDEREKTHLYSMTKKYYLHAHRYLTIKQVKSVFNASETAYKNSTPLNRFFTIHYNDYADPKRPQKFMVDILERTRKWLQYRCLPVAYVYVIEKGKFKGIHGHLLIHIPARHQKNYKQALKRWLPFEWNKRTVNVKTIRYPSYGQLSPLDSSQGILCYMCKGLDPQTPLKGIKSRYQGEIYGQRCGVSRGLRV